MIGTLLKKCRGLFLKPLFIQNEQLFSEVNATACILSATQWQQTLSSGKYQHPQSLLRHGFKAFSQFDEDGILAEIFRRIGPGSRFFVEVGVEKGVECNTNFLLQQGWRGVWFDADKDGIDFIQNRFMEKIRLGDLRVRQTFVTAENIETLLESEKTPEDFDLLSIDVDGNDYWVWKAITHYKPRVIAIEYNATWGPSANHRMPYDPQFKWDKTSQFGASLKALEKLGTDKGYSLVACSFSGGNAFFVRSDLVEEQFAAPFDSEHHWEPARYYLRMFSGHPNLL